MKKSEGHAMSGLFIFALLGAFAVLSTLLVMVGAQAYRGVVNAAELNAQERILLSYPSNKVRMNDSVDQLSIEQKEGVPMLVIAQDFDGEVYETCIYCYDGQLFEMFVASEDEFELGDGEPLVAAEFFEPVLEDGLFSFTIGTAQGDVYSAKVALRSQPSKGGDGT